MRPARGTARVNERLTQLLGVPCVGIKAIVDVIAADRGCREHIRAALLQRQRGELEPPIANPFPTRPPSTISPKPRQPGFPVAPVPPVRPMPAKPLADLPDVSDDATALASDAKSHADVVALVAARLSEGEQLEGASQRAKAGSGAVAGAVGGQQLFDSAPSPAAAVPVAAVPVAAPSAAAIAAVPGQSHTAPAAVSVAPCEALQRRKGLL